MVLAAVVVPAWISAFSVLPVVADVPACAFIPSVAGVPVVAGVIPYIAGALLVLLFSVLLVSLILLAL